MTNPPQEPGESSPEPEEATSEQESAVSDSVSDTAADPEPTASDAEATEITDGAEVTDVTASDTEATDEATDEATAVDAELAVPQPPADQPPPKRRKGRITAIVLVVALVLAGGGVAVYLVTRADQSNSTADRAGSGASSTRTTKSSESESESESADVYDDYYDDDYGSSTESSDGSDYPGYGDSEDYEDYGETSGEDEPEREIRDIDDGSVTSDDPDEVRLAYMAAYENKEFSDIVENSCTAYQERFGTDTQELEDALADFDVLATEDGDLDVEGRTATGRIDIELASDDNTDSRKILVKLVEERGKWRFCGEDEG